MSLMSTMARDVGLFVRVHINDIRINEYNFYDMQSIEELAELIEKNGANNGVVYESALDALGNKDSKHYTLVGGERRYQAIKHLFDKGKHDGIYCVKVISKPDKEWMEKLLIIQDNSHRDKTPEIRKKEVDACVSIFEEMKLEGTAPKGIRKREWIAKQINMSSRQVQEYLTGEFEDIKDGKKDNTKESIKKKSSDELLIYEDLRVHLQSLLSTKVKFKKNEFKIIFTDVSDLNRILEILGLGDIVNEF